MCGRYSQGNRPEEVSRRVKAVGDAPDFPLRFNICPTQTAPVALIENGRKRLKMMRWGLIPSWARDESCGNRLINARSETVSQKPSFRDAFKKRRCLIPADGYYEWKRTGAGKHPYRFIQKDRALFCFAGLWECWRRPAPVGELALFGGPLDDPVRRLETFVIITTDANEKTREIHHRMPAILPLHCYKDWLDLDASPEKLRSMLEPFPSGLMEFYPVSPLVNNACFDDPQCIEPLDHGQPQAL